MTAEATRAGCRVVECRGGAADDAYEDAARRVAPTLILDAGDALRVSSEEIFGPLLVVRTYAQLADALSYIAARPKPLALYYLGPDRAEERRVLDAVASGGVTVNDTVMHRAKKTALRGIGVVGPSRTRGRDGFRELSNVRGVHRQIGHAALQLVLDGLYPLHDRLGNIVDLTFTKMCALRTARQRPCASTSIITSAPSCRFARAAIFLGVCCSSEACSRVVQALSSESSVGARAIPGITGAPNKFLWATT